MSAGWVTCVGGKQCVVCGMPRPDNGVDPCWGWLPGVAYACCGHGSEGYVVTLDGRRFRDLEGYRGWSATLQGRAVSALERMEARRFGWLRVPWGRGRCMRCSCVGAECRCPRAEAGREAP